MIQRRALKTDHIKIFCLDEADEMLSRGFTDQIYDIFQLLPPSTQVVLLSATMPADVLDVTSKCPFGIARIRPDPAVMRDPIRILVKRDELTLEGIKQVRQRRSNISCALLAQPAPAQWKSGKA